MIDYWETLQTGEVWAVDRGKLTAFGPVSYNQIGRLEPDENWTRQNYQRLRQQRTRIFNWFGVPAVPAGLQAGIPA